MDLQPAIDLIQSDGLYRRKRRFASLEELRGRRTREFDPISPSLEQYDMNVELDPGGQ
jgi:hypothetical protein